MMKYWLLAVFMFMLSQEICPAMHDGLKGQRLEMVREQIEKRGVRNEKVLEVMRKVPRHEFVPERYRGRAYQDSPLRIGFRQTISQPYIVAVMTELLGLDSESRVLEIGTGSGYQAAVLAEITRQVYTVEIIEQLASSSEKTLRRLGYDYVRVKHGNGYYGWKEHAPYDAIIATAAAAHLPPPLVEQLKDGGRMVIPVGPPGGQILWRVRKSGDEIKMENIMGVGFVPFVRGG